MQNFFDDDQIELNPFAVYQTSRGISIEYPHNLFLNILKINLLKDCPPPLGDPKNSPLKKIKIILVILIVNTIRKITSCITYETF